MPFPVSRSIDVAFDRQTGEPSYHVHAPAGLGPRLVARTVRTFGRGGAAAVAAAVGAGDGFAQAARTSLDACGLDVLSGPREAEGCDVFHVATGSLAEQVAEIAQHDDTRWRAQRPAPDGPAPSIRFALDRIHPLWQDHDAVDAGTYVLRDRTGCVHAGGEVRELPKRQVWQQLETLRLAAKAA